MLRLVLGVWDETLVLSCLGASGLGVSLMPVANAMSIHFSFPPPGHPLPSPSCLLLSLQRWLFCGTLLHAGVYSNLQIDNFPAINENQEVLYLIGQQGAVETI